MTHWPFVYPAVGLLHHIYTIACLDIALIGHVAHPECARTLRWGTKIISCPECTRQLDWKSIRSVFWTRTDENGNEAERLVVTLNNASILNDMQRLQWTLKTPFNGKWFSL